MRSIGNNADAGNGGGDLPSTVTHMPVALQNESGVDVGAGILSTQTPFGSDEGPSNYGSWSAGSYSA